VCRDKPVWNSDDFVVPSTRANKTATTAAGPVEGRRSPKGSLAELSPMLRTQSRIEHQYFTRCGLMSLFRGSCLARLSREAGASRAVRSRAGALERELTASFQAA